MRFQPWLMRLTWYLKTGNVWDNYAYIISMFDHLNTAKLYVSLSPRALNATRKNLSSF